MGVVMLHVFLLAILIGNYQKEPLNPYDIHYSYTISNINFSLHTVSCLDKCGKQTCTTHVIIGQAWRTKLLGNVMKTYS